MTDEQKLAIKLLEADIARVKAQLPAARAAVERAERDQAVIQEELQHYRNELRKLRQQLGLATECSVDVD